jgi:hypothetical protein
MPAAPPVPLTAARAEELCTLIATLRFVFARTLPHIPHEYVVRTEANGAAFAALLDTIKTHGVRERYGKYYYRYLYIDGHPWRYWAMFPPHFLINRALVEPVTTSIL